MAKLKPIDRPEKVEYYIAQTGLSSDSTGRSYEAGDTVTSRDFGPETIANWLEIGALIVKPEEAEYGGRQE